MNLEKALQKASEFDKQNPGMFQRLVAKWLAGFGIQTTASILVQVLEALDPASPDYQRILAKGIRRLPLGMAGEAYESMKQALVMPVCYGVWVKYDDLTMLYQVYLQKTSSRWEVPHTDWRRGEVELEVLRRLTEEHYGIAMGKMRRTTFLSGNENDTTSLACIYLVNPANGPLQYPGDWFLPNELPTLSDLERDVVAAAVVEYKIRF